MIIYLNRNVPFRINFRIFDGRWATRRASGRGEQLDALRVKVHKAAEACPKLVWNRAIDKAAKGLIAREWKMGSKGSGAAYRWSEDATRRRELDLFRDRPNDQRRREPIDRPDPVVPGAFANWNAGRHRKSEAEQHAYRTAVRFIHFRRREMKLPPGSRCACNLRAISRFSRSTTRNRRRRGARHSPSP